MSLTIKINPYNNNSYSSELRDWSLEFVNTCRHDFTLAIVDYIDGMLTELVEMYLSDTGYTDSEKEFHYILILKKYKRKIKPLLDIVTDEEAFDKLWADETDYCHTILNQIRNIRNAMRNPLEFVLLK